MTIETLDDFAAKHLMTPDFWLGRVVTIHRIGIYGFVEYQPLETIDIARPRILRDTRHYAIYIDGRSISRHATSLEMAFAVAVAHKYDGENSRAATYFARMVGLPNGD